MEKNVYFTWGRRIKRELIEIRKVKALEKQEKLVSCLLNKECEFKLAAFINNIISNNNI